MGRKHTHNQSAISVWTHDSKKIQIKLHLVLSAWLLLDCILSPYLAHFFMFDISKVLAVDFLGFLLFH